MADYFDVLFAGSNSGGSSSLQEKSVSITQNGDSTILPDEGYDGLSKVDVSVNVSGGGEAPENDVEFIDYDGTIVYSYTAQEFLALDAMPANPTHEGLTAQGWNWTLADAKTYVTANGGLVIGQMYITDDGKTRARISIPVGTPSNRCRVVGSIYIESDENGNGLTIDYGDGNTSTFTGVGKKTIDHSYTSADDYIMTISADSGTQYLLGGEPKTSTSSSPAPFIGTYASTAANKYCCSYLYEIYMGENADLTIGAFASSWNLNKITLHNAVSGIPKNTFNSVAQILGLILPSAITFLGDYGLGFTLGVKRISFPKTLSNFGYNHNLNGVSYITLPPAVSSPPATLLNSKYQLTRVVVPEGVTTISQSMFSYSYGITKFIIPSTVTTINAQAFNYSKAGEIVFKSSTPPTVSSSNAFGDLAVTCRILVPSGSLAAYTSATNYPNPSTYTYVEY